METTNYPIEVSEECYRAVEEFLEEVYQQYPFERIFKGGKRAGYEGFIENFYLHVQDEGANILVCLIERTTDEIRHSQRFGK